MILYGYQNDLCVPQKNIGFCRMFDKVEDLDAYLNLFVASLDPRFFNRWAIYITNNDVEFHEMDHHHLMEEPYGLAINQSKFKKVDIPGRAIEVNTKYAKQVERREAAKTAAIKHVAEVKADESIKETYRETMKDDGSTSDDG